MDTVKHELLALYDFCFVLKNNNLMLKPIATLKKVSNRLMLIGRCSFSNKSNKTNFKNNGKEPMNTKSKFQSCSIGVSITNNFLK